MTGVITGTTPTLTPTTLASLEQTFIELQSVAPVRRLPHVQSGFVPPVVDPVSSSDMGDDYDYDSGDHEWDPASPPSAKRARSSLVSDSATPSGNRKGGRRPRYEKVSPEEEERRRVRRERNKVAAAKCRQRRVDHTNLLINETEQLEEEKATLENEVQTLQQQKEQLEFLLQAHKPLCNMKKDVKKHNHSILPVKIKQEPMITEVTCAATSRPTSLPLIKRTLSSMTCAVTEALGVPITTPSNGVFTFPLDTLVDHTGLTPIAGPSCASQVQRNSSDSSPDTMSSPSKLMAL